MSDGYQIYDQSAPYYMTFQIVEWVDVFTRTQYKDIIIDCFDFCRRNKGLQLYAYVIMTNHIHLIAKANNGFRLSDIVRDFKKLTANQLLAEMQKVSESRREWMLKRFEFAANKNSRNSSYQLWTQENHPVELYSKKFIEQKMNYIHMNPVRAGIVSNPEDFIYSSARNYAGLPSKIELDVL